MERSQAYIIAQKCAQLLKEQFRADNAYIFGSVVGDGIWHEQSDIDIAVEGLPSVEYIRALNALHDLLPYGLKLDLVSFEDMPAGLKACIKKSVYLDDLESNEEERNFVEPIDRLKGHIRLELASLERIARELDEFLVYTSQRQPTGIELSGVGGHLQSFYTGVERIFERIAVTLDGGLPTGDNWHILLLRQMEIEYQGKRSAVINHSLALRLLDYLRFRHLFRHTYGYELLWEKCRPLAEGTSGTLKMLQEQLSCALDAVNSKSI